MRTTLNEILTLGEAAERLRVSQRTTSRLIKAGELRASRAGHQWRIAEADIEAYLSERANRPPSERDSGEQLVAFA